MAASVMVTEDTTARARGSHRSAVVLVAAGLDGRRRVLRAGPQRGQPHLGGLPVTLQEQLGVAALVLLARHLVAGRRGRPLDRVVDLCDRPVVEQPRLEALGGDAPRADHPDPSRPELRGDELGRRRARRRDLAALDDPLEAVGPGLRRRGRDGRLARVAAAVPAPGGDGGDDDEPGYWTDAVSGSPARPAAERSAAALSVFSHVKSWSSRPKCPYAAVFW